MFEVIIDILSDISIWMMMAGILGLKLTEKKKFWLTTIAVLTVVCILKISPWKESYEVLTISLFSDIVMVLLLFEGGIIRRIAAYFCSIAYLSIPGFGFNLLLMFIGGESLSLITSSNLCKVWIVILTYSLLTFLIWYGQKKDYTTMIKSLPTGYIVIGAVCGFSASGLYEIVRDVQMLYEGMDFADTITIALYITSIAFYGLGIAIAVMSALKARYEEESIRKGEYLQATSAYVQLVQNNAKGTQKMRHDLAMHINALDYYMKQKKYEEAEAYLEQWKERQNQLIRKTASVNHGLVNAIIVNMQEESEGEQIRWSIEGKFPEKVEILDFDLCTIFSNLLNNAVEACKKLPVENRYIQLEIRQMNGKILIEVSNPTTHEVDVKKLGGITTKSDKTSHGFGIQNIQDMVKKNHGDLEFKNENGVFLARIIL